MERGCHMQLLQGFSAWYFVYCIVIVRPLLAPQELADGLVGQGGAVGGTSEEGDVTGSGGTAPEVDSGVTGSGKSPER